MILTIGFAVVLFLSLWGYFMAVGVMNFSQNPDNLETPLPGRPARRTIGRINQDVEKSIFAILGAHIVFICTYFLVLDYVDVLPSMLSNIITIAGGGFFVFIMTPANRRAHAYMGLGQLCVIHVVSSISSFVIAQALLNKTYLNTYEIGGIAVVVLGMMMTFSKLTYRQSKKGA